MLRLHRAAPSACVQVRLGVPASPRGFVSPGSDRVSGFPAPSQCVARAQAFFASPSLETPWLTARNPAPHLGSTAAAKVETWDLPGAQEQIAGASRDWGTGTQEEDKARRGSSTQQAVLGGVGPESYYGGAVRLPRPLGSGGHDARWSATRSASPPSPKYICGNPEHQR